VAAIWREVTILSSTSVTICLASSFLSASARRSPPAVVKAIEIMERDNSRINRLHRNIAIFNAWRRSDTAFDTCLAGETAVTPIMIGSG